MRIGFDVLLMFLGFVWFCLCHWLQALTRKRTPFPNKVSNFFYFAELMGAVLVIVGAIIELMSG